MTFPSIRFGSLVRLLALSLVAALALPVTSASAQDSPPKPPSKAAASVIDFYYNGQGQGVVLAKARICEEVPREGDQKYSCVGETDPGTVKSGTTYALHMIYLVPRDESIDNILVQYNRGGITRDTDQVSVSGSIRYRTWEQFTFDTTGDWQIKILHDRAGGVETLQTLDVTVSE